MHPFASLTGARGRLLPVTALRAPLSLVPQWRCMHMTVHSGTRTLQIERVYALQCMLCASLAAAAAVLKMQLPLVLADNVGQECPRLLINREKVGAAEAWSTRSGFLFDRPGDNFRDAAHIGDADDGVLHLCEHLGWADELRALMDAA